MYHSRIINKIMVVLVLTAIHFPAYGQEKIAASSPVDIVEAIRVIPMTEDLVLNYSNKNRFEDSPAFREELLTPTDDVEIVKDIPNGFVHLARHWSPDRKDPENLNFALFRGDAGRSIVVGSYYLNHPEGYWSRVEAYLWENGFWREQTAKIIPSIDLRNFYPSDKPPAKMFHYIAVEYKLPRKGTDIVAIPHDIDETDPPQAIRQGEEEYARLHPKNSSDQNRAGYFKAYRKAVKNSPYKKLILAFDRRECLFKIRTPD